MSASLGVKVRSSPHFWVYSSTWEPIEARGAGLQILAMQLDTTTATGKLMLNVLGSVAEFERSMMLERQKEGILKAKADGKYKGRAPTARAQADEVRKLLKAGETPTEVARKLGIGRSSVYRILEQAPQDAT